MLGQYPAGGEERDADAALIEFLGLMRQRLSVMGDVVRWKWNRKGAIEDRVREKAVLRRVREMAKEHGLPPGEAEAFFAGQIEAAKVLQRAKFREWEKKKQGHFADVPDLKESVRPRINALTPALLKSLAKRATYLRGEKGRERLKALAEGRTRGERGSMRR